MKYHWIPADVEVDRMIDEWLGNLEDQTPQFIKLCGRLKGADIKVGPGRRVTSVRGEIYLSHAQYVSSEHGRLLMGTISWIEEGRGRMLSGRLRGLVSAGVHAFLFLADAGGAVSSDESRESFTSEFPAMVPADAGAADEDVETELETLAPDDSLSDSLSDGRLVHSTVEIPKLAQLAASAKKEDGWLAAVEGAQTDDDSTPDGPPELKPGDILLHPRFGRCRVARSQMFGKVKHRINFKKRGHFFSRFWQALKEFEKLCWQHKFFGKQ